MDDIIGREIAFVLGIKFEYTNTMCIDNLNGKKLFVKDDNEEKEAIDNGLRHFDNYLNFMDLCNFLNSYNRNWEKNHRENKDYIAYDLEEINKIPNEQLYLSEMLVKVLYSRPKDIDCNELIEKVNLDYNGDLWGCCPFWVGKPFGNILEDESVYDNYFSRIIKLSSLNKTYCFCNLFNCKYYDRKNISEKYNPDLNVRPYPIQITVAIDRTCNLRCNSCRKQFYIQTEDEKQLLKKITNILMEKDILNKCEKVFIAGQGEVFYSPEYKKILNSLSPDISLMILSNGVLFDQESWKLIYPKFKKICVAISIDAFSKQTYINLRHGNFDKLMKNLDMLGELRKEGKIDQLWFNYVVQRENIHEMIDFVKMAKRHFVDKVQFTKLNNWGTFTADEYADKCLIIENHLDYDLYRILKDPIFQENIVDIDFFEEYMNNSKEYYEKED